MLYCIQIKASIESEIYLTMETGKKFITTNHKARRDYSIENQIEVGISLIGPEVKSKEDRSRLDANVGFSILL